MSMEIYSFYDQIPFSYSREINGTLVSGLTVSVTVTNAKTGATLLATTAMPEVGTTGNYTYNWTHGITTPTECLVTYSITGKPNRHQYILISNGGTGSSVG